MEKVMVNGKQMYQRKTGFFTVLSDSPNQAKKEVSSGYIYLVKVKGTKDYKIGTTKNIPSRISSLSGFKPYDIEMVFSTDRKLFDNRKKEKQLLTKYSHLKTKGEWIMANDDQVMEIVNDMIKLQLEDSI